VQFHFTVVNVSSTIFSEQNDIDWDSMEPTENRKLSRIITTLNQVAGFLRENGFVDQAIEVLEALAWGDSTFEAGDYAFELGLCYEAQGKLEKALKYFEIAFRQNPHVPGRLESVRRLENALGQSSNFG
jgi:tetratricopeptide (TPR) repeat protein